MAHLGLVEIQVLQLVLIVISQSMRGHKRVKCAHSLLHRFNSDRSAVYTD